MCCEPEQTQFTEVAKLIDVGINKLGDESSRWFHSNSSAVTQS